MSCERADRDVLNSGTEAGRVSANLMVFGALWVLMLPQLGTSLFL
jgi:hypothetical protein